MLRKTFGLQVVITRCGNFYGGGDLSWNRIVPGTIRSVVRGEPPVIRSDGQYVRDYFHVDDGAAAYMLLAEALAERPELRGQAFNFSNEEQITVIELVRRILELMGAELEPVIRNEATNEIRRQYLKCSEGEARAGLEAALLARRRYAPHDRLVPGVSRRRGVIRCRSCGDDDITVILSLGSTPLANSLLTADDLARPERTYPLDLAFCHACALVQITERFRPKRCSASTSTSRRSRTRCSRTRRPMRPRSFSRAA